ncbi:MAG: GNAT family N-acetyltransferase [Eubacteriaceae bacterium]|nr:GNAT family N-acetyltransferase [Eubacteriaceae bacterium]
MELKVKKFDELTVNELYDIMKERVNIFVVEQSCPYSELDDKDKVSLHAWLEEDGKIVAYCRVIPQGVSYEEASVGRVISTKRRMGYGLGIVKTGINLAKEHFKAEKIRIEAQVYARELYEKAGFRQVSDEFLEDGIPHIEMLWEDK